jgi:hypothetical protein
VHQASLEWSFAHPDARILDAATQSKARLEGKTVDWLTYFEANRRKRRRVSWERCATLEPRVAAALLHSLQRFQVGESGDGAHLLQSASSLGDPAYLRCLRLFVAEEQYHAQLLARAIDLLGGECLACHWSDRAFVFLRRRAGLRLELLVLLAAEIIGLAFYRALRDGVPDTTLVQMFRQVVADEEAHLAFHCQALQRLLDRLPPWRRMLARSAWAWFARGVAWVAWHDHHNALVAARMDRAGFLQGCAQLIRWTGDTAFTARPPEPSDVPVTFGETRSEMSSTRVRKIESPDGRTALRPLRTL